MSRILVLHASVGMGHHRAAIALARAFEQIPGTMVTVEDTLDHARDVFRRAYASSYLGIADNAPTVWSQLYRRTDEAVPMLGMVDGLRSLTTTLGVRGLNALLRRTEPDAIVCTHFLPLEVLGPLRTTGLVPPLYGVLTDYHAHHFWACEGIDGYFVPTLATCDQMVRAGLPRHRLHVTGIPIDPALALPLDSSAARRSLAIPLDRPVVMLNGSGIAPLRVKAIASELLGQRLPGTLLVTTGRNRELQALLDDLSSTDITYLRVLGPQPSLDPLIAASEVVVGKAGGLTVSEVLARGVPLIIPTPVPGQEQWNAAHVVEGGAGACCTTAADVARAVMGLLNDPVQHHLMATAARALGRPAAARAAADQVLAELPTGSRMRPMERLRPALVSTAL